MTREQTRRRGERADRPLRVEVEAWGLLACFTRPELKVERVSYPTMTPSAARGLLEAIFWKPEMTYWVERIEQLKPVRWTRFRRNEVNNSIITKNAYESLRANNGYRYDVAEDRGQRVTVALSDVAYRIHATIRATDRCTAPCRSTATSSTDGSHVVPATSSLISAAASSQPSSGLADRRRRPAWSPPPTRQAFRPSTSSG